MLTVAGGCFNLSLSEGFAFLRRLLSTFFYTGYFPIAPGTAASIAAAAVALGLYGLGTPWWAMAALCVLAFFCAVPLAKWSTGHFDSDDPSHFVLDEAVGMWVAALVLFGPWEQAPWLVTLIALFWFRVFDIIKPTPARQSEKIGHGWGICLDDIIAGVYAVGASWLTIFVLERVAL